MGMAKPDDRHAPERRPTVDELVRSGDRAAIEARIAELERGLAVLNRYRGRPEGAGGR